jgi:hypothetical protein
VAELRSAVERLSVGVPAGKLLLRARNKFQGRLAEEQNLDVYAGRTCLLSAKFFYGRKPYHFPWVELFTIDPAFFSSPFEMPLIEVLSKHLGPGGRIFIEYEGDDETRDGLMAGFPPPSTRLGYLLFCNGFTWFKDWYFAEGFYEGDIKLQGEKATDKKSKKKHMKELKEELNKFISLNPSRPFAEKALVRARDILGRLK